MPEASVIARGSSPGAAELRQFLSRNKVAHRWIDPDSDPLVRVLGGAGALEGRRLPLVIFGDGSELEPPEEYRGFQVGQEVAGARPYLGTARWRAELAEGVGLLTRPAREDYDVLVMGAGPAGLTAAVYAASEGLSTLVLERTAPGGQAGTSARIENYPGFPQGISGADLAAAIHEQALRFGAEFLIGVELVRIDPELPWYVGVLSNGATFRARSSVVAIGVHYRRLDAPGVEELVGRGVYYGSAPAEAPAYLGRDVAIVGAANSAGQAALDLARYARQVMMVVRGDYLSKNMSNYLTERIEAAENIAVRLSSNVVRAEGDERLQRVVIKDSVSDEETRLDAEALFILIGAEPLTGASEGWLKRDSQGFFMTGSDLIEGGDRTWWPLERDPLPLESSQPGVFIAGDVRHGSIKRVANAVGEGSMAIKFANQYLKAADADQLDPDRAAAARRVLVAPERHEES